jgi:hypothetical protein
MKPRPAASREAGYAQFDSLGGCASQGRAVNLTTMAAFEVHVFVPSVAPTDASKRALFACVGHIDRHALAELPLVREIGGFWRIRKGMT